MSENASSKPMRGDLTQGPIFRTLILFSLPTLLSNSLQSLNGTVNSIWVGRLIGENALAATANANIIMFLVMSAAFGFGMAGTVKIGQRYGARDIDGARRTFGTAVGFCFLIALAVAMIGWFGAPWLLDALGTPGGAWQLALDYLRMVFIAIPFVIISVILTMGLRGAGDARTPLIFMGLTVLLDVVVNPLLITGWGPLPELGITGSGLSMLIANLISFAAMIAYVYAKDLPLRLRGAELAYLKPSRDELGFIIAKGLPMGAQMLLMSAAGIIVVGLVNREGLLMTAAYGAAMQLFTYIQMPAMAIGGAVSAMAAQYIGARQWHRLDALTRSGIIINFAMTGFLTVALLLFDKTALSLFLGSDSAAVPIGQHIQLLASWNFILFGVTMVYTATMRAGGVVIVPLIILGIALYPVRLGFYYLTYDWLGSDAIWLSFPVSALAAFLMAWWYYRRPGWRKRAIAESEAEAREQANTDGDPAGRFAPNV
ncbi:MATE family efflux transporter [Altericroceibacterium spongiae]|uniref:MATE family efflux transporter n=1 Tax=Altericroceibacterium spongiae TaxID=2320269 RepID=A0A420EK44_9SPHN|nr:MATE family efflux transporter [Altericroceibacterium spongiae]RKF21092.1 MATE family efflux transporter [Altericroceibacterium spongiae]